MAVEVLIADPDAGMTPDLVMDPGHRDAAFPMQDHLRRGPDDLRIDVDPRAIAGVEFEHHHAQEDTDMRRGDPDPGRGMHGFGEVLRQLAQRAVEHGHGLRRDGQPGVGITDNAADGHDRLSYAGEWLRATRALVPPARLHVTFPLSSVAGEVVIEPLYTCRSCGTARSIR